jgi:hypothetical protein
MVLSKTVLKHTKIIRFSFAASKTMEIAAKSLYGRPFSVAGHSGVCFKPI